MHDWGQWGVAEREADKTLRGHEREADPTTHVTDSFRKSAHKHLGTPCLRCPQVALRHPQHASRHTPHPHTHLPPHGQLPVHAHSSSESELWQIQIDNIRNERGETSLAVQWLRIHASTAGGTGSIPGQGTKILNALQCGQKKKEKEMKEETLQPIQQKCEGSLQMNNYIPRNWIT